jgi:uncharacterized surface protein with fasciclin (FAS1) repeats
LSILLQEAGLDDDIEEGIAEKITIFGPIDTAFETVDEELLTYLLTDEEWNDHLVNLLGYHLAAYQVNLEEQNDQTVENIAGDKFRLQKSSDGDFILDGYSKVISTLPALNGIIHAIDTLLEPEWLNTRIASVVEGTTNLSKLYQLGKQESTFFNMATSSTPYTLFAPNNDAFDQSGIDFVDNLDLIFVKDVLGFHMVPGIYTEGDLTRLDELETSTGEKLAVETDPVLWTVSINGHRIVEADLLANNGVVHIVDGLLSSPKQVTAVDSDLVEVCTFQKVMEESVAANIGVVCNCQVIDQSVVLSCNDSSGQQCSPRWGQCGDGENVCCSPSQRRCVHGQCRDRNPPDERVKHEAARGGAEERTKRDHNRGN